MQQLSAEGQRLVSELAQRHGFSADAVSTLIYAVLQGDGTAAKLSHPELAGTGQWTPGDRAKGRVDALYKEITTVLAQDPGPLQPGHLPSCTQEAAADQSEGRAFGQSRLFVPVHWWPEELGTPSATGAQNNVRYAYFADTQRLAVETGAEVWVYDTQDHRIGGLAPQQAGDTSITFKSQFGTVNLAALPVITRGLRTQV